MIYIHGGGFVGGSTFIHEDVLRNWSKKFRIPIIGIDYRISPKYKYPEALDDIYQRQEAVPYNMSLGGGSIGLLETILPDYYALPEYLLPIERDFCGTFIGDIKSFKIYEGFINYSSIANYLS